MDKRGSRRMSFLFPHPDAPPPPPPPPSPATPASSAVASSTAAQQAAAAAAAGGLGFDDTVKTGGQGARTPSTTGGKMTLGDG